MPRRLTVMLLCLLGAIAPADAASLQDLQNLLEQKRYSAAAETGAQLLQQYPDGERVRFLVAYAYQMNGQAEQAIALYRALIVDNPGLPEPRNNLAMIYLERGDYDRASQMLIEAINSHPSYATAYDNLSRIYKGIASEAYRRAVSESSEPAKYRHDIELTPLARLESLSPGDITDFIAVGLGKQAPAIILRYWAPRSPGLTDTGIFWVRPAPSESVRATGSATPDAIEIANRGTLLIERVKRWARAWSDKDFDAYTGYYAPDYRADQATREQWIAQRRSRILRPGDIRVAVDAFEIRSRSENRAIIDFRQSFDSPTYSDRVVKRLVLNRIGGQWKITEERVLSVL